MGTHSTDGRTGPVGRRRQDRLPPGVIDDILASRRRRQLLDCLLASDRPVAVDDLATELAETASDGNTSVSARDRQQLRTELYQEHLPKLTATGVVGFDSLLGTVEFTGPESLEARLQAISGEETRQSDPGTKDK